MTSIERQSHYWVTAQLGKKDELLFEVGVKTTWQWARSIVPSVVAAMPTADGKTVTPKQCRVYKMPSPHND